MTQNTQQRRIRPGGRNGYRREMQKRRIRFFLLCIAAVAVIATIVGVSVSAVKNHGQGKAAEVNSAPATTPKPAPQFPPASEQNDLLKIASDAQGREGKACYLTFDDGPTDAVTPEVLDVLKNYDVPATFFMLGKKIEENPEIAKRAFEEGHLLANHSYSHDYQALYATGESFMAEVEKTNSLIQNITGEEPFKLVRFPGGGYNAGDHAAEKQKYKTLLQEKGYYYADWNALNGDAEGGSRSAAQLLEKIKATATQKNIVVLMHDAAAKKTTAEALPSIIEYLKNQGYQFYRLDEVKYYQTGEDEKTSSMIL